MPKTNKIELHLTKHEVAVLRYLIDSAASPYAADPLKDIYELGIKNWEPYDALHTLADKLRRA